MDGNGTASSADRTRDYLDRFVAWSRGEPAVRSVILLGSQAQVSGADALSDIDLMVITTRRRRMSSLTWLDSIVPAPLFSYTYVSPIGGQSVSQAVYEGPLVVDVALVARAQALATTFALALTSRSTHLRHMLPDAASSQLDAWRGITARGAEVLLDKDGLGKRMVDVSGPVTRTPAESAFLNIIHSFLGLALWESKQLVRGERWMALWTVDQQVKQCLLTMLEWHTVAINGEDVETWYGGRHLEDWADVRWTGALPQSRAPFDVDGAWGALLNTLELFSQVARETAEHLGYRYPVDAEHRVRHWIEARQPTPHNPEAS